MMSPGCLPSSALVRSPTLVNSTPSASNSRSPGSRTSSDGGQRTHSPASENSRHAISEMSTSPGTIAASKPSQLNATYSATSSAVRICSRENTRRCSAVWKPNLSSSVNISTAPSSRPTHHDSTDCGGSVMVTSMKSPAAGNTSGEGSSLSSDAVTDKRSPTG